MRMSECLPFAVPSPLLPPGAKSLTTYQHPMIGFCRCAREARSQSLHILAIALLQIPVAVLPCGSMCAELFLELGWGAPFPASVHHRIP